MNFELTKDQQLLEESAERYLQKSYPFEHRNALAQQSGFSRATWSAFAEMGWLMVTIPEAYSGLGLSAVESALLAEQIGRGLVLEPYTLCGLFPAALVQRCATEPQKQSLLAAIGSGELLIAVAHSEAQSRGELTEVATRARRHAGGYLLSGRKTLVVGGPVADRVLVIARTGGVAGNRSGLSAFLLDPASAGVRLEPYRLLDGTPAADLMLEEAAVPASALLGAEGAAFDALQRAVGEAIVALCAETMGGIEDVMRLTSEHLKTRRQFGVAIGSFQALQHRFADMAIERMLARATLHRALEVLAHPDRSAPGVLIGGCKAQVTRSAKFVTTQGIQLHGGYGITEEYRVGHHWRRLVLTDALFGNVDHHLNRYAQLIRAEARSCASGA
jgi:alkylation response protein AidB-like acyl-CoA dehydrogenase